MIVEHIKAKKINITTISPIHIGCDEEYSQTNFVIKDHLLHFLDMAVIADELTEAERKALGNYQTEGAIQQFFKSKRDRFAPLATHLVEVAKDIAKDYEAKVGMPTQQSAGKSEYNFFQIFRTAYNPLDIAPYLPGSSLKGSMRTALLNAKNKGQPLLYEKETNPELQQRLLGYDKGDFENDPLRHLHIADAHHDEDAQAAPTQILYAVSKKKRVSERGTPELKVFLETIPALLNHAFAGEIRLTGDRISWQTLCDACNDFYYPQLEAELNHLNLSGILDAEWRKILSALMVDEIKNLRENRQGFLLRVGKHSGAESLTLNGVRNIKILGKGGAADSNRPETTEKRFASHSKVANSGLLPFGWLWIEACDDAYQHVAISMHDKIQPHSNKLREAQKERLSRIAQTQQLATMTDEEKQAAKKQQQIEQAEAWKGARITFNSGNGGLTVEKDGKSAIAFAPHGEVLLQTLPADIQRKIKTNQYVRVTAHVFERDLIKVEPQ